MYKYVKSEPTSTCTYLASCTVPTSPALPFAAFLKIEPSQIFPPPSTYHLLERHLLFDRFRWDSEAVLSFCILAFLHSFLGLFLRLLPFFVIIHFISLELPSSKSPLAYMAGSGSVVNVSVLGYAKQQGNAAIRLFR
jgi:hypothetical protein